MDSHLYTGYLVPPNYDSLLGKLIVWGADRTQVGKGSRFRVGGCQRMGAEVSLCGASGVGRPITIGGWASPLSGAQTARR